MSKASSAAIDIAFAIQCLMTHLVALLHSPQVLKDLCDLVGDNDTLVTSAFDALIEHDKIAQYAPPLWVDLSPCLDSV